MSSFKKYLSKIHPARDDLWQKPRDSFEEDGIWYCNAALGKNTLSNMMASICKTAKLNRTYNNHSIRATSITLLDSEFASRDIMKVSGHKSETSIKNYATKTSETKLQKMSKFLHTAATESGDNESIHVTEVQVVQGENNVDIVSDPTVQDVQDVTDVVFLDQEQIDNL